MLNYSCKKYQELSLDELYAILAIRQEIFVVEQNCPYLDADGKDQECFHILGINAQGKLLAYTRLVPRGISYDAYPSIGRVVVAESCRGTGEGYHLMNYSIQQCTELFDEPQVKISAQTHLEKFYNNLGFEKVGAGYLEDDIPHIAMIRS